MTNVVYSFNEIISNTEYMKFSMSDSIILPKGDSSEKVSDLVGSIRFNEETNYAEIRDINGWAPIGNFLLDEDGDTKISVEATTGSDDDTISFTVQNNIIGFINENGLTITGTITSDLFVGEINGGTY